MSRKLPLNTTDVSSLQDLSTKKKNIKYAGNINSLTQKTTMRFDICGDSSNYSQYLTDFKAMHLELFQNFIQLNVPKESRKNQGLEELLQMYFPIHQTKSGITISYLDYDIIKSQFSAREAMLRNINYSYILKILINIKHNNPDTPDTQEWVIAGEIPAMTENAIFVINGHMRVFVTELQKCPGVVLIKEEDIASKGQYTNIAKLYPAFGSWLHFKFDKKGLSLSIDKNTKLSIILFMKCCPKNNIYNTYLKDSEVNDNSYSIDEILANFYTTSLITIKDNYAYYNINPNKYKFVNLPHDIYDLNHNKIYSKNTKILETVDTDNMSICCPISDLANLYLAQNVEIKGDTIYLSRPIHEIQPTEYENVKTLLVYNNNDDNPPYLLENFTDEFSGRFSHSDLFAYNQPITRELALKMLSRQLKISAYHNNLSLAHIFEKRFFDPKSYDLRSVGRWQLNRDLDLNETSHCLTLNDIVGVVKKLIKLGFNEIEPDNIDGLKKKIAYTCFDIMYEHIRSNLNKFKDVVADRTYNFTQNQSIGVMLNASLITNGLITQVMNCSHLHNDLNYIAIMSQHSKIDNDSRTNGQERIPTSKRDIHYSQLGRICTTQTAEGKKVGLSLYMTGFCKIDHQYGLLLTPYHRVIDGVVQSEVVYLNAFDDEYCVIGDVSTYKRDANNQLVHTSEYVLALQRGVIIEAHYTEVELVMICPNQINSFAISLVPRMENNDLYRSMLGGNMHVQALPTFNSEPPILGTGMNAILGHQIVAPASGIVVRADVCRVVIMDHDGKLHVTDLGTTKKTNSTTLCQYKLVANLLNSYVEKGDLIADGLTTRDGDLAVGHNVLVCFKSDPYTYEDSAQISEGLIQRNIFSSVRKKIYTCAIQDTRLGSELLTKNIPGASASDIRHLDEAGIALIGAKVAPGEILVGKISPQAPQAELEHNNIVKAMFNNIDTNYRDTSLRVPPYVYGIVSEVEILTSRGGVKDHRTIMYEKVHTDRINNNTQELIDILNGHFLPKFQAICEKNSLDVKLMTTSLNLIKTKQLEKKVAPLLKNKKFSDLFNIYFEERVKIENAHNEQMADITVAYDLPNDNLKVIRITLVEQHSICVGDKIAGRCANKAVISQVLPECDMPYLPDGRSIDICLSSMGVMARMNNAQIYEAFIGYAVYELRKKIESLIRDIKYGNIPISTIRETINEYVDYATGAYNGHLCTKEPKTNASKYDNNICRAYKYTDEEIYALMLKIHRKGVFIKMEQFKTLTIEEFEQLLVKLGLAKCEKTYVYDGQTGERSETKVTVGYLYVMALHHTADSKIHARSLGPVSTMSLQPVYGKSRNGGQRFGEMEGWAESAKGCAYSLQETLNAKSDSVMQKKSIVRQIINSGQASLENIRHEFSEGFRNLVALLRACGLDVLFIDNNGNYIPDALHVNLNDQKYTDIKIQIVLMDPKKSLEISKGQITNAETRHFKTFEPIKGGLCDMAIFGSPKDYQCKCGELRGIKNEGLRCPKCKVLIANKLVCREHFGHIKLATPVVNPLFIRFNDNKVAFILGIQNKVLNDIIALKSYVITSIGKDITKIDGSLYKENDIISSEELERINKLTSLKKIIDFELEVLTGGDAVKYLINNLNISDRLKSLKQQLSKSTSLDAKRNIGEQIALLKNIVDRKVNLQGLILENLLILPQDLRPIAELSPGTFAASDLNYKYKDVMMKNMHLADMAGSEVNLLKKYQQQLFQESVASCIGANNPTQTIKSHSVGKDYKSILETISGKDGLLRRVLLGKRVDFSGRAVIVPAPMTELDECFIPEVMGLELFRPHIIGELLRRGIAHVSKIAIEMIKMRKDVVLDILNEIASNTLVLLNRAPTLHRIGIMAFKPKIWKNNTIGLNPLTCLAYGADFDGDQMAIHIPLSTEANAEAFMLSRPSVNVGSPAHGGFMIGAFKDMIYGLYALTSIRQSNHKRIFYNISDAFMAYEDGLMRINDSITVYMPKDMIVSNSNRCIETSIGRLIFMKIVPTKVLSMINLNKCIDKKDIQIILNAIRNNINDEALVKFMNHVQQIGFKYASYFSASFGLEDFINLKDIKTIVQKGREQRIQYSQQLSSGFISNREFNTKCMNSSLEINNKIVTHISSFAKNNPFNPIIQVVVSGARSKLEALGQLFGAKGNPLLQSGDISPMMIFNNHSEGMTQLEYYSLSHGARKGCRDVALSTAEAGYLTRRLVDIAHSCVITETSCKVSDCILAANKYYKGKLLYTIYEQILGRTLAKPIVIGSLTIPTGVIIGHDLIELFKKYNIQEVYIFSPVLCGLLDGVCRKCYGADLSTMKAVPQGYAAGIIAAQSMGEPSTQLTMVKNVTIYTMLLSVTKITTPAAGKITFHNEKTINTPDGKIINIARNMKVIITNEHNHAVANIIIPYGAEITSTSDAMINANDIIAITNTEMPFIAHQKGKLVINKLFEGINYEKIIDEKNNICLLVRPHIITPIANIIDDQGTVLQQIFLPEDAIILAENNSIVEQGSMIGYIRKVNSGVDITTGGLQHITNILENSAPGVPATIAPVSGTIKFKQTAKKNVVIIVDEKGEETILPRVNASNCLYSHDNQVNKGDIISSGSILMQEILDYRGIHGLIDYVVTELQSVYILHGLNVNNKHFEIILSQMTRMYLILSGENIGQLMHKVDMYAKVFKKDVSGENIISMDDKNINVLLNSTRRQVQGITKAALMAMSFLSQISFQTATSGLSEHAINGSIDRLTCSKSCIITGKQMHIGTGYTMKKIMNMAKAVNIDDNPITTSIINSLINNDALESAAAA